ncbi:hypothetical protein [Heterosigma akashiwo virus 01]|uniref:Uncharacterized protein n=1 Tax=Heterosigma akashiwo virus 01 TaxID=97195 RepID=A0A1C9C4Y6_HAV01|nr:hypothetical protein D1R72_gp013 [Heterosigma akashiwo virus 01]AOM63344.1 hypothetical protein [Heterosigma akashiwo virus 01]
MLFLIHVSKKKKILFLTFLIAFISSLIVIYYKYCQTNKYRLFLYNNDKDLKSYSVLKYTFNIQKHDFIEHNKYEDMDMLLHMETDYTDEEPCHVILTIVKDSTNDDYSIVPLNNDIIIPKRTKFKISNRLSDTNKIIKCFIINKTS